MHFYIWFDNIECKKVEMKYKITIADALVDNEDEMLNPNVSVTEIR